MILKDLEERISFLIGIGRQIEKGKNCRESISNYRKYIDQQIEEEEEKHKPNPLKDAIDSPFQNIIEGLANILEDMAEDDETGAIDRTMEMIDNTFKYSGMMNYYQMEKMISFTNLSKVLRSESFPEYATSLIETGEICENLPECITYAIDSMMLERSLYLHQKAIAYSIIADGLEKAIPILDVIQYASESASDSDLKIGFQIMRQGIMNGKDFSESMTFTHGNFEKQEIQLIKKAEEETNPKVIDLENLVTPLSKGFRKLAEIKKQEMQIRL